MHSKNLYIIAGPNGSGKTTFARKFLPLHAHCDHFINVDLIAQGLSPFSPRIAAMKAGRIVLKEIQELSNKGATFAFETTLSGKTYLGLLKSLRSKGYQTHLFFLWVPNPNLALERIKERVREGGHNVPAVDVRRRFPRSIENFLGVYQPMLDSWMLFDSSQGNSYLVAEKTGEKLSVKDAELYGRILKGSKNGE